MRKNERVSRDERKPMLAYFTVLDQPVTSEISSNILEIWLIIVTGDALLNNIKSA